MVYFTVLPYLPLADASSIFYTAPLFAIAFSAILLKEKVAIHRWCAIWVGLLGVLIIIRPGGDVFNVGGIVMLSTSLIVGFTSCVLRLTGKTEHPVTTTPHFTLPQVVL